MLNMLNIIGSKVLLQKSISDPAYEFTIIPGKLSILGEFK